ncbi:MAG: hypothetical protein J7485_05395 [Sphingobium sp.]|nr:hypothetical protein [Sphingobium sp.]
MLLFAAAIIAAATPVQRAATPQKAPVLTGAPVCQQAAIQKVGKAGKRGAHKLSQEPSAKELKAVLYTEGGCAKPLVVRDQVGNTPTGK